MLTASNRMLGDYVFIVVGVASIVSTLLGHELMAVAATFIAVGASLLQSQAFWLASTVQQDG